MSVALNGPTDNVSKNKNEKICELCGKIYKSRQSLYRHRKACIGKKEEKDKQIIEQLKKELDKKSEELHKERTNNEQIRDEAMYVIDEKTKYILFLAKELEKAKDEKAKDNDILQYKLRIAHMEGAIREVRRCYRGDESVTAGVCIKALENLYAQIGL